MRLQGTSRTAAQAVGVVVIMGSLAWASVPLYDWFCRVTGYGGTTARATDVPTEVLDRTIKIRFDASKERDMPWEFRALQHDMELRIGETGLAFYEAYNPTDRPVAGSASYNVAPFDAGSYFTKIACFCFEEQVLQPGERVQMPVSFYVDPSIVDDRDAKYARAITLSYTFYEIDLPEEQAALDKDTPPLAVSDRR